MKLVARISALVAAIGADVKAMNARPYLRQVATFNDLPASVSSLSHYYVVADETNKDDAGNPQPSLYILSGSTKLWSPLTPV